MKRLFFVLLMIISVHKGWCNDGDVFTYRVNDDWGFYCEVISEENKTCQIGSSERAAIEVSSVFNWPESTCVIPAEIRGYKVIAIGDYAFYDCENFIEVTIPEGVVTIGEHAFAGCKKIEKIHLPSSLKSIGKDAFGITAIQSIIIPEGVTTLGDFVFAGCNLLESVSIPNSVDLIGVGAFSLCSNLEKIILPTNLKTIEEETFLECVKLSDVSLPEGLETIKEMAFMWCSSLSFITLPSSLKYIEGGAFRGCVNLSSINLPNKLEFIGDYAFSENELLSSFLLPKSVKFVGMAILSDCQNVTEIKVEEGNSNFDSRNNCNAIIEKSSNTLICGCQTTIIPDDVEVIGKRAFENCRNLTTINFPPSVSYVDEGAFYGCSMLNGIVIPGNIKEVAAEAFYGCGFSDIAIQEGVKVIGPRAFEGCSLQTICIPNSLTEIGNWAFCSSVKTIYSYIDNPFAIEEQVFDYYDYSDNTYHKATLYVPLGTKEKYQNTDGWKLFLNIVEQNLSGINAIREEGHSYNTYDLFGRMRTEEKKGINIVRKPDGSAIKVLKK